MPTAAKKDLPAFFFTRYEGGGGGGGGGGGDGDGGGGGSNGDARHHRGGDVGRRRRGQTDALEDAAHAREDAPSAAGAAAAAAAAAALLLVEDLLFDDRAKLDVRLLEVVVDDDAVEEAAHRRLGHLLLGVARTQGDDHTHATWRSFIRSSSGAFQPLQIDIRTTRGLFARWFGHFGGERVETASGVKEAAAKIDAVWAWTLTRRFIISPYPFGFELKPPSRCHGPAASSPTPAWKVERQRRVVESLGVFHNSTTNGVSTTASNSFKD